MAVLALALLGLALWLAWRQLQHHERWLRGLSIGRREAAAYAPGGSVTRRAKGPRDR